MTIKQYIKSNWKQLAGAAIAGLALGVIGTCGTYSAVGQDGIKIVVEGPKSPGKESKSTFRYSFDEDIADRINNFNEMLRLQGVPDRERAEIMYIMDGSNEPVDGRISGKSLMDFEVEESKALYDRHKARYPFLAPK